MLQPKLHIIKANEYITLPTNYRNIEAVANKVARTVKQYKAYAGMTLKNIAGVLKPMIEEAYDEYYRKLELYDKPISEMDGDELYESARAIFNHCMRTMYARLRKDGTPAFNYAEYLVNRYGRLRYAVEECISEWYLQYCDRLEEYGDDGREHYHSVAAMSNAIRKQAIFEIQKGIVNGNDDDIRYSYDVADEHSEEELEEAMLEEETIANIEQAFANVGGFWADVICNELLNNPEISARQIATEWHINRDKISEIIRKANAEYHKIVADKDM